MATSPHKAAARMNETRTEIVAPRPAATVVILRDGGKGLEVFMVVRHQEIDFASGALVFPGGKVDAQDSHAAWAELAPYGASAPDRTFVVAAVRETFEEAGLVLARRRGVQALLDAEETHRLVETYRAPLLAAETTFVDIVRREELSLATDLMLPFAHWITPERVGKRFDTHFLLVAAPVEQLGAHDGGESLEGFWIAPRQALADAEAGARTLVLPTQMNLLKLCAYASVAEAVAATRAHRIVTVTPRIERVEGGRKLHIPAEAGYGVTEVLVPAVRGRGQ
jgi:8-oxo-dGTP pyrophosphatase MutT (NUDIX family)